MEPKQNPIVSVLVPTYNVESYIEQTIESVLAQSFQDFEIVMVDDCSIDGTWKLLQELAKRSDKVVVYQNETNSGIAKTRNATIRHSRGEFLATLDADDWCYPERLEKQVAFLRANERVGIVGSSLAVCDSDLQVLNTRVYQLKDETIRRDIFLYNQFAHSTTMIRRGVMDLVGGYNENIEVAVDYDLYFRLGRFCDFANLDEVLVKLRTHERSITQRKGRRQELLSIYFRVKALLEYGYTTSFRNKALMFIQFLFLFLVPFKVKFWLFNFLRK